MKVAYVLILSILIPRSSAQEVPVYSRYDWKQWTDADHDCQDTRQEVLIEESVIPVTLDEKGCKVVTGRWICPYTGRVITNPSDLDIDHMVPLNEAHKSGGWRWDKSQKSLYANDLDNPNHLIAVYKGANRSKGDKPPQEWLPENKWDICYYLVDWVTVKNNYDLEMTPEELEFIRGNLKKNCEE